MKQALELFNSKSYLKAERLFLLEEESHPLISKKYLYLISKALKRSEEHSRLNDYLHALGTNAEFDDLAKLYFESGKSAVPIEARNYSFLLEALWLQGKLDDFEKVSRSIWAFIIERKLYSHAKKVFEKVQGKHPYLLNNYFAYMISLAETGDAINLKIVSSKLRALLEKNFERVKRPGLTRHQCYEKFYSILKDFSVEESSIAKEAALVELNLHLEQKKNLRVKNIMEFIILFKDEPAIISNLLALRELPLSQDLRDILKISGINADSSSFSPENLNRKITKKSDQETSFDSELLGSNGAYRAQAKSFYGEDEASAAYMPKKLSLSESEKEIIARIKANDPDLCSPENAIGVAHSLVGVGFYEAALAVIELNPSDPRLYFVRCHCLHETDQMHQLEDFIIDVLATEFDQNSERLPFLHLLAKAQLRLGRKEAALATLKEIVQIDPNFRNTEELLRIAKA